MSEVGDRLRDILALHGVAVMMDEAECVLWRSKHEDCHGCPHRLGCNKLTVALLVHSSALMYRPHSFEDQLKTQAHLADLTEKICVAETAEQLDQIARGSGSDDSP